LPLPKTSQILTLPSRPAGKRRHTKGVGGFRAPHRVGSESQRLPARPGWQGQPWARRARRRPPPRTAASARGRAAAPRARPRGPNPSPPAESSRWPAPGKKRTALTPLVWPDQVWSHLFASGGGGVLSHPPHAAAPSQSPRGTAGRRPRPSSLRQPPIAPKTVRARPCPPARQPAARPLFGQEEGFWRVLLPILWHRQPRPPLVVLGLLAVEEARRAAAGLAAAALGGRLLLALGLRGVGEGGARRGAARRGEGGASAWGTPATASAERADARRPLPCAAAEPRPRVPASRRWCAQQAAPDANNQPPPKKKKATASRSPHVELGHVLPLLLCELHRHRLLLGPRLPRQQLIRRLRVRTLRRLARRRPARRRLLLLRRRLAALCGVAVDGVAVRARLGGGLQCHGPVPRRRRCVAVAATRGKARRARLHRTSSAAGGQQQQLRCGLGAPSAPRPAGVSNSLPRPVHPKHRPSSPVECVVLLIEREGVEVRGLHVAGAVVAQPRGDAVALEGVGGACARAEGARATWEGGSR
jgi:hypothetical protein